MARDAVAMERRTRVIVLLACGLLALAGTALGGQFWELPAQAPPYMYGDILIDRLSSQSGEKAVYFSHWSHRLEYTCRVCHFELEIEFRKNTTEMTEQDNRNGLFCGACHDGDTAFGHTKEHCDKCHTGKIPDRREEYQRIWKRLPHAPHGNRIDWVRAARVTKPAYSFYKKEQPFRFEKKLLLAAEWAMIPPAEFPHSSHIRLLDCSNCHPDVFNIRKKTTKHFLMQYILDRKFCGMCHYDVAFPMDDCDRCHPGIGQKER